ncbi:hypothetical protein BGV67_02895 [Burkholderia ubonensis]|uniref:hypothetical protein n=1 Tax=Burkholderia ubonensis TaxID=101571 RepID=UPI00075DD181|nr:hypothetical protein [Burkholderia ubonensis]KVD50583.1 hypothetical protein WI86_15800 [Burkholderia ubonensis]KWK67207.1 hypothetical protein WM15_07315 [Burkholderia ubonensis]OJA76073.1 hypothetical protein BGV67_02895 [Burkholderia ubonensis]OJB36519.1 hypothetical protein BGV57_26035 [Burkholderia ubonensis]
MSELKIEHPDYELAEQPADRGCAGCAFSDGGKFEGGSPCLTHACFTDNLPDDHPLRDAVRPLIWVRKA